MNDPFLTAQVCNQLSEGDYVINCGSPESSLSYSNAVFSPKNHGMVITIEPEGTAYASLKENLKTYPHQNVYALQAFVDEIDGITGMYDEEKKAFKVVADKERIPGSRYILSVSIDFIAHQANHKIAFITLDTTFQVRALLGASKTLKHDRPSLLIKVDQAALLANGDSEKDIVDILVFHDYKYELQSQAKLGDAQFHLLCTPNKNLTIEKIV